MGEASLFTLINKMRATVFVFAVALLAGVQAGCEWYKNCGACVADSGCGWCSNDPVGVGSGSVASITDNDGRAFEMTTNEGTAGDITLTRDASVTTSEDYTDGTHGVEPGWLVNVRGQYENVTEVDDASATKTATLAESLEFEGTGYVTSPYFGQTWGGADRSNGLIGIHKTKFTTESKDGYTIKCQEGACSGTDVRVKTIYNDQLLHVDPRFTTSFAEKAFSIEIGPPGTGLISGTTDSTRIEGSDPCRTSNNEPCYENTRFLTELRINDRVQINANLTGNLQFMTVASIRDDAHLTFTLPLGANLATDSKFKIKSFHSSPFTYARSAQGGLASAGVNGNGGEDKRVYGYNSTTFTKNLMEGYGIILQTSAGWERRIVTNIDRATSLTIDEPFSAAVGVGYDTAPTPDIYNYESCPSLTYENFDLRTENGPGVIQSDGTNHVYDNVQYSMIRTYEQDNPGVHAGAAMFVKYLKVGMTLTMDSIT